MNFTGKEDIEKPIEEVFAAVTDHEAFEKQVLRRGHEITRTDALDASGVGMSWKMRFPIRGQMRDLNATVSAYDKPEHVALDLNIGGLDAVVKIDLIELSKMRTRMSLDIELMPRTITSRVLVQSLRLRRSSLTQGLRRRMAEFALQVEARPAPAA
ncbi:SRPBCC family protein [Vannielia litorea]|uniref:SRPBCC family protein n=1 Tax=Vannielia TaxID=2813041 RepID=UPI001C954753|nr:SRPBCC family protein [Vannielia litorea]MBY6049726.1 SRPBCC family protein [Vannielia litorea]MBY6077140.1 SRPBCC family protein [Vannielia litorea]MBY6155617.1 SRPBCC family protein [Vannielia litorea]